MKVLHLVAVVCDIPVLQYGIHRLNSRRINNMKLVCKSNGFLQALQALLGAEVHQSEPLQFVH